MQANVSVAPLRQDAGELERRVRPDSLVIVMETEPFCMHWYGVTDDGALMRNNVMRGAFSRDASLRREFLASLGRGGA